MPTVPRYTEERNRLNPLPNVRLNPNASDEEAFGGGQSLANLSTATQNAAEAGVKVVAQKKYIAQQQKKIADEFAVQDADLQAGLLENDALSKAKQLRGKDAFGAKDLVDKNWKEGLEKISGTLSNPEQKFLFQRKAAARYLSLDGSVNDHTNREIFDYQKDSTKAYMENELNSAVQNYDNPDLVQRSIFTQQQAFLRLADIQGFDEKQRAQGLREINEKTYKSVINQFIQTDPDLALKKIEELGDNLGDGEKGELRNKAITIKNKIKDLDEIRLKEQERQNVMDTAGEFLSGKLSLNALDNKVTKGILKPEEASIFQTALYNPKSWKEFSEDKEKRPEKGVFLLQMIDRMSDPGKIKDLVIDATKGYNDKIIDKKDLTWIIHTANEKIKNPDDKKWDWLSKTASGLVGSGAEAISKFVNSISQNPQQMKYELNQVITHRGRSAKIVGFDADGEPLIEAVKSK